MCCPMLLRGLHVLALGMWFGGAAFFNFVAAPAIFESFKQVVYTGPSDRTANETIISADADPERMKALASALAGSAVGPIFPKYFLMQAICGLIALVTAVCWRKRPGAVNRWRVYILAAAWLLVLVGWPLSDWIGEVRLLRFHQNAEVASQAKAAFASWHLVSLLLSFVTVLLAGIALAMAAKLPNENACPPTVLEQF